MKHKQLVKGFIASAAMLVFLFDGESALHSAQSGIDLCIKTIVPSLLPFLFLSIIQTNSFSGNSLPFGRFLSCFCGIPKGAESILVSSYLGGYPVGAQCIASAYKTGVLQQEDAERMLSFGSNAGPVFLFGMLYPFFPSQRFIWLLWGIHILSSLLVAQTINHPLTHGTNFVRKYSISFSEAMQQAISIVSTICGWVILFRVIATFINKWMFGHLSTSWQTVLMGFLELTNGCYELSSVSDISLRFVICSCLLAFGGICVLLQTISVIQSLSPRYYIAGKLLQTVYSFLISVGIAYRCAYFTFPFLFLILMLLRKQQKNSRFRTFSVV